MELNRNKSGGVFSLFELGVFQVFKEVVNVTQNKFDLFFIFCLNDCVDLEVGSISNSADDYFLDFILVKIVLGKLYIIYCWDFIEVIVGEFSESESRETENGPSEWGYFEISIIE